MIDYKQEARDQGCLHIAVKPVGEISRPLVQNVMKLLQNMPPVQLAELKGSVLFLRFLDGENLPCWATGASKGPKWDQFSAHKTVHGFLGLGLCQNAVDVASTLQSYRENYKLLQPQLCAHRCILYGPEKELEHCISETTKDGVMLIQCSIADAGPQDVQGPMVETVVEELVRSILYSLKARMEPFQKVLEEPNRIDPLSIIRLRAPMETMDQLDEELEQR